MQKLIYVPPGERIDEESKTAVFTAARPFILEKITGLGGVESDMISSGTVGIDGEVYQGGKRAARIVRCWFTVSGTTREDMYYQRMRLIGMLTASQLGNLYYWNDCIAVRIPSVPQVPPDFEERIRNYNKGEVAFYCPNPDWRSVFAPQERNIMFTSDTATLTVDYEGSAAAPVVIQIQGSANKMSLTNEKTSKSIVLKKALQDGETLIISTEKGQKNVLLQKDGEQTSGWSYINPVSEFWEILPGVNHFILSGAEAGKTKVGIKYETRYAGV